MHGEHHGHICGEKLTQIVVEKATLGIERRAHLAEIIPVGICAAR